jgi:type II secretory pathway component PulF
MTIMGKKGEPDPGIIGKVVYGAIGLVVLFLLMSTIVLPQFNTTYGYTVTGLSSATTQGIFLLVLFLALIGFAIAYLPKIGKK